MQLVPARTPKGHLGSIYCWLGKAAVVGGAELVMRKAASDRFVEILSAAKEPETRRKILEAVASIVANCEKRPRTPKPPNPNERVKVLWTDDMIARFKREAPFCKDNVKLAKRLGLPDFCAGSMKAARRRYLPRVVATGATPKNRPGESLAGDLRQAA